MPRIAAGAPWEQGFRAAVRTSKPGWTVSDSRGRVMLKYRPVGRGAQQAVVLPLDWSPTNTDKALLLINRIVKEVLSGQQESLRGALEIAQAGSNTMKKPVDWDAAAEGLRKALMTGRNEILPQTWKANYQPFVAEALRLLRSNRAILDGHDLLQSALTKWAGKAASRSACCIALRNFTDHAIARHHAAACWRIDPATIKELRGKAPKRRTKATLEDQELIDLIEGIGRRNTEWANILRLLAVYGLRPVELQFLQPKCRDDGSLGLWCAYSKNCGGALTDPRWLEPCWLLDATGAALRWNLAGAMNAGLLELPVGSDGEPRDLNGHYVEMFLKRQPEWKELKRKCQARGEWLRGYSFRDSFSLRCHRQKIEVGAIARAMGHSLDVHARSYRWASDGQTAAAFAMAFQSN